MHVELPDLECVCASLRRAARAVSRQYDRELRVTGLNAAQFTLLDVLARQDAQPVTQGWLGEVLALDSTTLTRTLAPLVDRKWIRSAPGQDRRERLWSITAAGLRQLEASRPRWERAQKQLRDRLGDQGWEAMLEDLTDVATAARMRSLDGVKRISRRRRRK